MGCDPSHRKILYSRELARFMSNPEEEHRLATEHLLRYPKRTVSYGIFLGNVDDTYPLFHGVSDSD